MPYTRVPTIVYSEMTPFGLAGEAKVTAAPVADAVAFALIVIVVPEIELIVVPAGTLATAIVIPGWRSVTSATVVSWFELAVVLPVVPFEKVGLVKSMTFTPAGRGTNTDAV